MVRTRMAPSPTGEMHVGSLSIALKNYAYAKRHHGSFILRIEDTDKVREVENGVQLIQDILTKYGITWDEGPGVGGDKGPYLQSERLEIYKKHANQLIENDKAYYCFCSTERLAKLRDSQRESKIPPKYDGLCASLSKEEVQERLKVNQPYVIRLRVPKAQDVTFSDLIRGDITFNSDTIDDQVLIKSDGFPTYHLAVVVDDHEMEISHVMRGEEWISSTPKHILLYKAFGWKPPVYAHIPVFLNPDGKGKMSKRKGTVSAQSFLDQGYLPEAVLNFFMILGWAHPEQKEIISLEEYIKYFDPKDVSLKSVVFDLKKLRWINGIYIRNLTDQKLQELLDPYIPHDECPPTLASQIIPLIKERLEVLSDFEKLTSFFYRDITLESGQLLKKADKQLVISQLDLVITAFDAINDWSIQSLETTLRNMCDDNNWKKSQFFMMIRYVVSGSTATPPLFEMIAVLGKDRTIDRLKKAKELL